MSVNVDNLATPLTQGTEEWHRFRHSKIGGSDAPVIMGTSPWKTPEQLFKEKIKPWKASKSNAAMERGNRLEPAARSYYEFLMNEEFTPMVLVDSEFNFLSGSFDGHNASIKIDLEIKCSGKEDHLKAIRGNIPEKYYPQVQHLLSISKSNRLDYLSFTGRTGTVVSVYPDEEYILKLRRKELIFWECVQEKKWRPNEFK